MHLGLKFLAVSLVVYQIFSLVKFHDNLFKALWKEIATEHTRSPEKQGRKVAIQYIDIGKIDNSVAQSNHRSYCAKWGYDRIVVTEPIANDTRGPVWQKIPATLHYLEDQTYDYIMWMDTDAIFVNCSQSLDLFLDQMEKENTSWLFSGGTVLVNAGQMIFKNSPESKEILRAVDSLWYPDYDKEQILSENGAFAAYLGGARRPNATEISSAYYHANKCWYTRNRDYCSRLVTGDRSVFDNIVNKSLQEQISYVPKRSINVYLNEVAKNGVDFIFHCAGEKNKTLCLNDFMKQSKQNVSSLMC